MGNQRDGGLGATVRFTLLEQKKTREEPPRHSTVVQAEAEAKAKEPPAMRTAKKREEEKAETVLQLLLWGPH